MASALESTQAPRRAFLSLAVDVVIARVEAILSGVRRWHAAGMAFRQLQSLSDEQLKDIGLHRSHIPYLAREFAAPPKERRHAAD
jgi:uncharacterized protein YjiS (DUF1127 family)